MDERAELEKYREQQRKARFSDFDRKYEAKNEWYQKNIIQPAIEKRLNEFDIEKEYNQKLNERQTSKEREEALMKKSKETRVFKSVQRQMALKQKEKQLVIEKKRNEHEHVLEKVKEAELQTKMEKEQLKGKRLSYRQLLDQ